MNKKDNLLDIKIKFEEIPIYEGKIKLNELGKVTKTIKDKLR
jgi:hypothetical protein